MHVVVGFQPRHALPVVTANPEDAVIAGTLEAFVKNFLVKILRIVRSPVVKNAHPTLAIDGAVDRIAPVEWYAIGT